MGENVELIIKFKEFNPVKRRLVVLQSPQHCVRKHAAAVGLSACFVRRMLHEELKFHP